MQREEPRTPAEFQNELSPSWERLEPNSNEEAVAPQVPTGLDSFSAALRPSFPSSCFFPVPEAHFQPKGTHCSHHCVPSPVFTSLCSCARPSWQVGEQKRKKQLADMYKSPAASVLVCGGIVHTRETIQMRKTKLGHIFSNHLC